MVRRFFSSALVTSVTMWFSTVVFEAALVKSDDAKIWVTFMFLSVITAGVAFWSGIITGKETE